MLVTVRQEHANHRGTNARQQKPPFAVGVPHEMIHCIPGIRLVREPQQDGAVAIRFHSVQFGAALERGVSGNRMNGAAGPRENRISTVGITVLVSVSILFRGFFHRACKFSKSYF